MPLKDYQARLAYQRRWYAANSAKVVQKVTERKHTAYIGTCLNCDGPTKGQSKNDIPQYCSKSDCMGAQRRGKANPRKPTRWRSYRDRKYVFRWGNNPRRAELKGRQCVIEAVGALESALVRFLDTEERVVVSRRALGPPSAQLPLFED